MAASAPQAPPERPRRNHFDALRLVAAALVIWGHQYAILGLPVPLLAGNEPGALGVVMFFAISGYLVTGSWQADPHLGRFALRRFLRIWPALSAAVLLSVLILGPLSSTLDWRTYFQSAETWRYLSNLWLVTRFTLPGVFEHHALAGSVNGPLWTIPIEVGCYAVLALAGVVGATRYRWAPAGVLLILAAWIQWRHSPAPGTAMPPWSFNLQYGMVFALGSLMALCKDLWQQRPLPAALAGLAACSALHAWGPQPLATQGVVLGLGALTVLAGQASWPLVRNVGRWGDLSYGLYIYAFPVQQLLATPGATHGDFTSVLLTSVGCALALAGLSWHLLEKPALGLKPRAPVKEQAMGPTLPP